MIGTTFYIPIKQAVTPANGECLVNRYWVVHPEKGVAFYAQLFGYGSSEEPSPQCNRTEYSARFNINRLHPGCDVMKIPVVFLYHAVSEMGRLRKVNSNKH